MTRERYIERSFPIVQLNPLSVRERNAFKPVYKMHKWFARRSASIFRAILLASALPYEGEDGRPLDLMAEFYQGHGDDPRLRRPDGRPLKVLDPFMGGGTTVVEALRLGFDVVGNDYNPIAWFIVKGETTPVDPDALQAAYERLAAKVKEPLLAPYRTRCPLSGRDEADIIYGFWVKQGICTDPACGARTDLFKDYEVGRKRGDATLRYLDVRCPACGEAFDWELHRCTITAGGPQVAGAGAAGNRRPAGTAYAWALESGTVACPHCRKALREKDLGAAPRVQFKQVPLHVLVDPTTRDFFEVRGAIPDEVTAPASGHTFRPKEGTLPANGKFACRACGRIQRVVDAAAAYGQPLPFRYYGIYAHTSNASQAAYNEQATALGLPTNNGKWFAAVSEADREKVRGAEEELAQVRHTLPLPEQEIPWGRNFRDLLRQGYKRWSDLYGPRHLLGLGKLLRAIAEEGDADLRDALLGAFQSHVDNTSVLCKFQVSRNQLTNVTGAHDYRNPTTTVENNIWGVGAGQGPFSNCVEKVLDGIHFIAKPSLSGADGEEVYPNDAVGRPRALLFGTTAARQVYDDRFDLIVTDPPYAGSVQYAEMSDWSYVWLHHILKDHYPEQFGTEITLKAEEIIEDNDRKDARFFFEQLTLAWKECHRVLVDDGLLVFTFHHREGDRWTGLLRSIFDAGFYLIGAYPTHSEALNSIVIQATQGITYDIVHVCRKRLGAVEPIAWTQLRREVQREARAELARIEASGDVLPGPDVWMILLGKALKLFSQHYGQVLDEDGAPLDLDRAIERLRVLVREVRGEMAPLPAELHGIDGLSQVALIHLPGAGGWTRDGLHIELRGYAHSPDDLLDAGLVAPDPKDGNRLVPMSPIERVRRFRDRLADGPGARFVDKLHLLLATVADGSDPQPLLRAWRGFRGPLGPGLRHLARREPGLRATAEMALALVEELGPDMDSRGQLALFGDERGPSASAAPRAKRP